MRGAARSVSSSGGARSASSAIGQGCASSCARYERLAVNDTSSPASPERASVSGGRASGSSSDTETGRSRRLGREEAEAGGRGSGDWGARRERLGRGEGELTGAISRIYERAPRVKTHVE